MRTLELIIDKTDDGKEIKSLLENKLKLSRRLISGLKNNDGIKLNGDSKTVRTKVKTGDKLEIIMPEKNSANVVPVNIPLDILYEDDDLLAVNKPLDMPVHPSLNNYRNTLGNAVMYYFKDIPFTYRPVNRLDRDTTGVVIIAKTPQAANSLSKQMQKGIYEKEYCCITEGIPVPKEGTIDAPIMREKESIIKRVVASDGQYAVTNYKVEKEKGKNAILTVRPVTGRTHQIRVHLSYIGCPLKNDFLYGKQKDDSPFMLHCKKVTFNHPVTGIRMSIEAPIPEYFKI